MHSLLSLCLCGLILLLVGCKQQSNPTEARIDSLVARMTLEEKLGQLNQFSYGRQTTGPATQRGDYKEMLAKGLIGSFLNANGPDIVNEYQRIAMEQSRLKIPLIFGFDVIHGYWTTFPIPLALSATWNPELIEQAARVAAKEAASDGIRWTFSPMVDIARDARWGRVAEGAGEDTYLGETIARAYVRGYQGKNLADPDSIAACAKHFVGYGAAEGGRDYAATELSENTLRNVYLPPFHACVDAGAVTFMSAFNAIAGIPASANALAMHQILKNEWKFDGFIVSDWGAIRDLIDHGVALDGAAAARKSILAGVDMDMEGANYVEDLPAEIKAGRVPMSRIDEAVRRVLRVKMQLGLFENPYTPKRAAGASTQPTNPELARVAAEQSFVLLKNEKNILPLTASAKTIALIGPLADSQRDMLGCWSGKGYHANVVTLRSAIEQFATRDGRSVIYEKGTDIIGKEDHIAAAVEAAKRADVVLLAVGEDGPGMTGEANSRAAIDLPGLQPKLLDALAQTGKPIVMIVFSGRPLALTPYVDKCAAIVEAWHPGLQAGPALERVLSGKSNFSGRLTMSFPRSLGQVPIYYNVLNTGRPARDPDKRQSYTTGYVDEKSSPLYPFGFGLSYTTFDYSKPTLSTTNLSAAALNAGSQSVKVRTTIRNTGDRDGVEVAQLYIRLRGTSIARPIRELKGFQRIELKKNESREIEFTLDKNALAFWNDQMKFTVEPSKLTVWISKDAQSGDTLDVTIGE